MLMKAPILLLLATALSIFTGVVSAQSKVEKTPLSIGMAIDSFVSRQMKEQHITGLSLGIIINGKLFKIQGYGLSNIEQSVAASAKTVYKIGSLSKQVVATATMLFVQEGKLKLTDSLPMFFKGAPKSWNKITIRHLLNHTSGLPRESPIADNMKVQPDSVLIKAAYQSKLLFEPGTSWQYCNLGYFMLADIIRQLSGKTFAAYMEDEIFKKYDLLQTRTTTSSKIVLNRAAGYVYNKDGNFDNAVDYLALRPSGAFLSSINNLAKWEMLIQNGKLLTPANWKKMWADTVRTSNTVQTPNAYYGYGWDVSSYKGLKLVHHNGTLPGFSSSYLRFIDSRSAIIILTNADNTYPKAIALGIADILLKDEKLKDRSK